MSTAPGTDVFALERGSAPLIVSVPHAGTAIPDDLRDRMLPRAFDVEDTDWHLDRVYAFVRELSASFLVPRFSRYLIDLNRPPDDRPMYAGANNTELCPTRFFTGEPLYRDGAAPTPREIGQRRERYWLPYHAALQAEIDRVKQLHGYAVIFDGHSILSELPWLFEGRLPDLNLGTADGASCSPSLREALAGVLAGQREFSYVVDGRFKGGYITRHYGRPAAMQHAVQLEMCFACYLDECTPSRFDASRLRRVHPVLRALVETMVAWRPGDAV